MCCGEGKSIESFDVRKKDSKEIYNFFKNSKEIRNKIIEAKQHLPEVSKLK